MSTTREPRTLKAMKRIDQLMAGALFDVIPITIIVDHVSKKCKIGKSSVYRLLAERRKQKEQS